jgi:membrane protein required for colicin V production
MVPFDIACAILVLLVALRAALRGFVEEVAGTASVVLGALLAGLFFDEGAAFIRQRGIITVRILPEVIAFVVIFIAVFVTIRLIEGVLKDIIQRISLSPVDHLLGFFFGVAEALVLIVLALVIINIQPLFDKHIVLDGSLFARFLLPNAEALQRGLQNRYV